MDTLNAALEFAEKALLKAHNAGRILAKEYVLCRRCASCLSQFRD